MTPLDTLERERAKYGATIWPIEAVQILNAVAWAHRDELQLVAAPRGGNGWDHPNGFIRIGHLANVLLGRVLDVFEDGPDREPLRAGPARPQWNDAGELAGIGRVAPMKPITLPADDVPEKPVDPEKPVGPAKPIEVTLSVEALTVLLGPFARIADAVEDLARAALAHSAALERLEKNGLRVRL